MSESLMIHASDDASMAETTSSIQADVDCATALVAMVKADFCRETVRDTLLQKYSEQELLRALHVSSADDISSALSSALNSAILSGTSIINLYVTTNDQTFSADVLAAFIAYIYRSAASVPNLDSISSLGGSVTISHGSTSVYKTVILSFVLSLVLAICVIMVIVLFDPYVACKKDFECYCTPVLGSAGKRKDISYTASEVAYMLQQNKLHSVAVVSSVCTEEELQKFSDALANELSVKYHIPPASSGSEQDNGLYIYTAKQAAQNFDVFSAANDCGGILVVEKTGFSKHRALAELLALFQPFQPNLLGIVLL